MNFQSIDLLELVLVTVDKSVSLFELHIVYSVAHLCPTLCNPKDCSPLSSSVHGILQASIPGWVAISFSRGSSQFRDQTCVSCVSCTTGGFFTTELLRKPMISCYSTYQLCCIFVYVLFISLLDAVSILAASIFTTNIFTI